MKTITNSKSSSSQSIPLLWTPLPERQQEMLSGGAPTVSGSGSTNTGGTSSGGTSGSSTTFSILG